MFDAYDELFMDIILRYRVGYEKEIVKSLKYELLITSEIVSAQKMTISAKKNGKTSERGILMFGIYDRHNEEWGWINGTNIALYKHLEKYGNIKEEFGSDVTINKLFVNKLQISNKFHYAIPYFIAIFNPMFNLVRFSDEDNKYYLYALVQLNIKHDFDFNNFIRNVEYYKNATMDKNLVDLIKINVKPK
jgi:hypothetical protein